MKGTFMKIVLAFLVTVGFSILVFFLFSGVKKSVITPLSDVNFNEGKFTYSINNGKIKKIKIENEKNITDKMPLIENNLDVFSTIYSKKLNYIVNVTKKDIFDIEIEEGIYVFDFKYPFKKIVIHGDNYNLKINNGGLVYVENLKNKVMIASFNSVVGLDFINPATGKIDTSSYIYPHMYFGFLKRRFVGKKLLDYFRVSQLAQMGYFSGDFGQIIAQKKVKFVSNNEKLLFLTLKILEKRTKYYQQILKKYQDIRVAKTLGEKYIEKYFSYIYNEDKKIQYYKNKILDKSIKLLFEKGETKDIQGDIVKYLNGIKEINEKEHLEMLHVVKNIYFLSFYYSGDKNLNIKNNYHSLLWKALGKKGSVLTRELYSAFTGFNSGVEKNVYAQLVTHYRGKEDASNNGKYEYDYYLFFMQQVILNGFKEKTINIVVYESILELFGKYSQEIQAAVIHSKTADEKEKFIIANLIYHDKILRAFIGSLDRMFFSGRDEDGLLQRNRQKLIGASVMETAEKNLQEFYLKNMKYLYDVNDKYILLKESYENSNKEFEEYILALNNGALYKKNYSPIQIDLLTAEERRDDKKIPLNPDDIMTYLSKFQYVMRDNLGVEVIGDYYKISNFSVKGKVFSFELYPYDDYRIENIRYKAMRVGLSESEKNSEDVFYENLMYNTYYLSREEKKYKGIRSTPENIKSNRTFISFFGKTFLPTRKKSTNIDYDPTKLVEVNEYIHIFKSAKLLGVRGEFSMLKGTFKINYNNLQVEKKGGHFSIHIDNALFDNKVKILDKSNKFIGIFAEISADYKLDVRNHYFYNISIRPYIPERKGRKRYIFGRQKMYFFGKVYRERFIKDITTFMEGSGIFAKTIGDQGMNYDNIYYNPSTKRLMKR